MNASIALPTGIIGQASRTPARWERNLDRRELFSLDTSERLTLSCLDGMLWVTLDRDSEDYVLATGQALRLPAGQQVTIQALTATRFGVARG